MKIFNDQVLNKMLIKIIHIIFNYQEDKMHE